MRDIFRNMNESLTAEDILMLAPLQLAYIGDAVYELFIRMKVLDVDLNVNKLHKKSTNYVKAESQSKIVKNLEEVLSEKEKSIVKKGRNAKSNSPAKNADLIDYKYSTGFEALIGYLYINRQEERLEEIFEIINEMEI